MQFTTVAKTSTAENVSITAACEREYLHKHSRCAYVCLSVCSSSTFVCACVHACDDCVTIARIPGPRRRKQTYVYINRTRHLHICVRYREEHWIKSYNNYGKSIYTHNKCEGGESSQRYTCAVPLCAPTFVFLRVPRDVLCICILYSYIHIYVYLPRRYKTIKHRAVPTDS